MLPTNIGVGWKGLPGTNALAYYKKSLLTAIESFLTLAPGAGFTGGHVRHGQRRAASHHPVPPGQPHRP